MSDITTTIIVPKSLKGMNKDSGLPGTIRRISLSNDGITILPMYAKKDLC